MFSKWVVSDLTTDSLMHNHGPSLSQHGVTIESIDWLRMFDTKYAKKDCLVVMSCVCPRVSWKDYLSRLHVKCAGFRVEDGNMQWWYQALVYDAVVAQLSKATVVSITRKGDFPMPSYTPPVVCPSVSIPGYHPTAYHPDCLASLYDIPHEELFGCSHEC